MSSADTFETEAKILLSAAIKRHPDLNTISPRTLLRWAKRGTRGVRLESIDIGGRTFTSLESVGRFLAKLNGTAPTTSDPLPSPRSPHQRQRASEAAAAELAASGC